jgi:pimeloyl-ACP methyl ester carboxylesterase
MNTSVLMDIMILKDIDKAGFEKAIAVVSSNQGEPYETAKLVRECFADTELRQSLRSSFYWINQSTMNWWLSATSKSGLKDSDEVYFRVASTYGDEPFNSGLFDPDKLPQKSIMIHGFFDFLMNGSANPRLTKKERAVRFNGSANYPHFEQPELFMKTISEFLTREKQ